MILAIPGILSNSDLRKAQITVLKGQERSAGAPSFPILWLSRYTIPHSITEGYPPVGKGTSEGRSPDRKRIKTPIQHKSLKNNPKYSSVSCQSWPAVLITLDKIIIFIIIKKEIFLLLLSVKCYPGNSMTLLRSRPGTGALNNLSFLALCGSRKAH